MLYDLEWLHEGALFPPDCECERLSDYQDHKRMFDGEESVFNCYSQRIQEIIEKFRSYGFTCGDGNSNIFQMDLNYFRLLSLKTKQLLTGDPPTISGKDDTQTEKVRELIRQSKFVKKLKQCVVDASRYGDGVGRVYKKADGKGGFTIISPEMWFPIVDRETNEIKQHCICWTEKEPHPYGRGKETFYIQIHDKGFYTLRAFIVKDRLPNNPIKLDNGRSLKVSQCMLGRELLEKQMRVNTGLKGSAIVLFQNFVPSDSVFGVSDYEDISCIIAELQVRYAVEAFVLDKHSAPTMYVPDSAIQRDPKTGEYTFKSGTCVPLAPNEQPPGYLIWDASFHANHEMIVKLEKHLFALSQMGAVLNDDAFGASQGFEALEVRLTNAKSKARDMASDMTDSVIEAVSLISQIGYDAISPDDLSVQWNEGLPTSEFREINIANQKKGLFSRKTILKDHFGLTDEKAEEEVDEVDDENARTLASGFSTGIGGGDDNRSNDVDEEIHAVGFKDRGDDE